MSNNVRALLQQKIFECIGSEQFVSSTAVTPYLRLIYDKVSDDFTFTFPLRTKVFDVTNFSKKLTENNTVGIKSSFVEDKRIHFQLDKNYFIKDLIDTSPSITVLDDDAPKKNVVVEFSSPNIAKPFHVGHLRSTLIGNFVANINKYYKNNVKTINYLGDWGTQFGFVQLGICLADISEEEIRKDPIRCLYNGYIYAHKLAEEDPDIAEEAKSVFKKLEAGEDMKSYEDWKIIRGYTLKELAKTYNRLGIQFDEYQWESSYSIKNINKVLNDLKDLKLLSTDDEDREVVHLNIKDKIKVVPIIKSDGSTLYITRDIAAAIDRYDKYQFDMMYYVVDTSQSNHFINLTKILDSMKYSWSKNLKHIRFGRIRNMSTRQGSAIFLKDIIDETRVLVMEKQLHNPTTKVNLDIDDSSSETLGISAIIINDLRHKRKQDYDFNWDSAMSMSSNGGIKLQYTHCRLVSLENNCGASLPAECDPSLLPEETARELIYIIGKFDEILYFSFQSLEPYILVAYLFELSHSINKTLKSLRIKGESTELGSQRLLLMNSARHVLGKGMRLLGLKPLEKM